MLTISFRTVFPTCFDAIKSSSRLHKAFGSDGRKPSLEVPGFDLAHIFLAAFITFFNSSLPSSFTFFVSILLLSLFFFFLIILLVCFFSIIGLTTSIDFLLAVECIVTRPTLSTVNNLSVVTSASK